LEWPFNPASARSWPWTVCHTALLPTLPPPACRTASKGGRQPSIQLLSQGGEKKAVKVVKARYRLPGLVSQADRLEALADLPGLEVCRRTVLPRVYIGALEVATGDTLTYATHHR